MWVFAIAQILHFFPAAVDLAGEGAHLRLAREFVVAKAGEVVGNHAVVLGGVAEGFAGKIEAGFVAQLAAVLLQLFNHGSKIGIVGNNGHVFPVFCGRAHHGGAAYIDVFNRIFQRAAGLGDGGGKGIKIHAHHIDVADFVLGHFGHMLGQVAATENAAVDFRVQRFHAPVEHFGEACVVGHFNHGHARIGQQFGGAAGGKDFNAQIGERAGKIHHAGFVGQAD